MASVFVGLEVGGLCWFCGLLGLLLLLLVLK